ncbi:MAG: aldo/keto reductase [Candidatus Kapabacteria bacterium]|nr:aldo/keto reductase [Candidatus Kapabacteria bacterium]
MKYRQLGKSGLLVSELCFGAMTFGGDGFWKLIGSLPFENSKRLVDIALDGGINFFDTADVYSFGMSEEFLGKALGDRRKDIILATKVRGRMSKNLNDVGLSRHHILNGCNESLKRLATDYIDLYIVHSFDFITPLEETLSALNDLVGQGKVRYLGVSNYAAWQLMKALSISERKNLEKFVSLQALYSLLSRDLENELVPLCLDQGIGITPWSPLYGGFLTGKFRRGMPGPSESRRGKEQYNFLQINEDKAYAIVDELEIISKKYNATIAQSALNYLLRKPGVSSVIISATKPEQLEDNLKTVDWILAADDIAKLDALSSPYKPYPHWMLEMTRRDRENPDNIRR